MIAVVFLCDEPRDVEMVAPIIDSICEAGNLELGRLGLKLRGYIAVDKTADEVTSMFEKKES